MNPAKELADNLVDVLLLNIEISFQEILKIEYEILSFN